MRKVLAVCMKKGIADKLDAEIPPSKVAFRAGRNTTENAFHSKGIGGKGHHITNHSIYLLMLNMSKAFDTVN